MLRFGRYLFALLLVTPLVAQQNADPQVYWMQPDGSVMRAPLNGGEINQIAAPRANAGKALAFDDYSNTGVFVSGSAGLVRYRNLLDTIVADTVFPGVADTVDIMDILGGYYAAFGSKNGTLQVYTTTNWSMVWSTLTTVYNVNLLDGCISNSGIPYALYYDPTTLNYTVVGWNSMGVADVILQTTDELRGLAAHNYDTLVTYNKSTGVFARLSISNHDMTPTTIATDSVKDLRVLEDGRVVWTNGQGIWVAKTGEAPMLRHSVANIQSIVVDGLNSKPTWSQKRLIYGPKIPQGSLTQLMIPNWMPNDGDQIACRALPSTVKGTIHVLDNCKMFFEQQGVVANAELDSVKLELKDARGSKDTTTMVWQYTLNNAPPSFSLPATVNVEVPNDLILKSHVAWEPGDLRRYNFQKIITKVSTPATIDTACAVMNDAWISQSFMPVDYGVLQSLRMNIESDRPLRVIIQEGQNYNPDNGPLWSGMVTAQDLRNGFPLFNGTTSAPSLSGPMLYVIVVIPQSNAVTSYCKTNTDLYTSGLHATASTGPTSSDLIFEVQVGDYNTNMVRTELNNDSLRVNILPGLADRNTVQFYKLVTHDGIQAYTQNMQVQVAGTMGTSSPFVAGADVRVPLPIADWQNYRIPNWLTTEATAYPRSYVFEYLNQSDTAMSGTPSLDMSTLSISARSIAAGPYSLRVQRCRHDTILCSNWDTVQILFSSPPTLTANIPVIHSIEAGLPASADLTVADVDVGDVALAHLTLSQELILYSQMEEVDTIEAKSFVQTFQTTQNGQLNAISVPAYFNMMSMSVSILEVESMTAVALPSSPVIAKVQQNVKYGQWDWHEFSFPNVQLQQGKTYGILIGSGSDSSSYFKVRAGNTGNAVPGQLFLFTSNGLLAQSSKDLTMKMDFTLPAPAWTGLSKVSSSLWKFNMNPARGDTGLYPLRVTAHDGTGRGMFRTQLTVTPSTALPLIFQAGVDLHLRSSPETSVSRKFSAWADVSALPADRWFNVQYGNPLDSLLFNLPMIDIQGNLRINQKGLGQFGVGSFVVQACTNGPNPCSLWDTVKVALNAPPQIQLSATGDTIRVGDTTTLQINVLDNNAQDLTNMVLDIKRMDVDLNNTARNVNYNKLVSGTAFGQTFVHQSPVNIGAVRVYGRFPRSYVRVLVASAEGGIADEEQAIFDQYVPVAQNLQQWHELLIPLHTNMVSGQKYHISFGYDDSVTIQVGVDTLNSYAGGSMIRYLDHHTDTLPGHELVLAWDLSFELKHQFSEPHMEITGAGSYWAAKFVPTETGNFKYLIKASDPINHIAKLFTLLTEAALPDTTTPPDTTVVPPDTTTPPDTTVVPPDTTTPPDTTVVPPDTTTPPDTTVVPHDTTVVPPDTATVSVRMQVMTQGQAMRLRLMAPVFANLPRGSRLQIQILGAKDSAFTLNAEKWTWLGAPVGQMAVQWALVDSNGRTRASGDTSVSVSIPIHTPPQLQTWYMIGFGEDSIPFSQLKADNQVFTWDDTRSVGIYGNYRSRAELTRAKSGQGYWYFAENADTLRLSPVSQVPSTIRIPVVKGSSGWNMISNPYSWPISLEGARINGVIPEFWAWHEQSGEYRPITVLNPFMACWVNTSESASLTIPMLPALDNLQTLPKLARPVFANLNQWTAQISLTSGASADRYNFIGVSPLATDGLDDVDGYKPPQGFGSQVSLTLVQQGERLSRDLRKAVKESQVWTIEMESMEDRQAQLTLLGISNLKTQGWTLVLKQGSEVQEIIDGRAVTLSLRKGTNQAEIQLVSLSNPMVLQKSITGLQVLRQGQGLSLSFQVPLALQGSHGVVEWVSLNGVVLARETLSNLPLGVQNVQIQSKSTISGVSLLRIRVGKESKSVWVPLR